MKRAIHSLLIVLLFGPMAVMHAAEPSGRADDRPNIIVFYTDDHGHADLGCQDVVSDIRTPNVDALAARGVRAVHGYSTAPQCVPSRGGLLVGRFQCRFGLEANGASLDGFNQETTIAERLQSAGYVTAQFGKWHLGPTTEIPTHGFTHVFSQNANRAFTANVTLDGQDRPIGDLPSEMYHVDGCSRAAAALIERYRQQPFFLYIAYRAPHVPLDAPKKYLDRFPGEMPERRRQALAMLSAVDDGVGLVTETLKKHGLTEKTLIFYIGDNGAPLKIHKADEPGGGPGWDGSLNDPLNGEKGMLAEGGMHVPYVVSWPSVIRAGQVYQHPVSALDVAATAAAAAGLTVDSGALDGVNLAPYLNGQIAAPPHDALMWRWVAQSAIREGKWKLLRGGDREYLYDLEADLEEKHNLAADHPEIASRLRERLAAWADELEPPGLAASRMAPTWNEYFDHYLEGKLSAPPDRPARSRGDGARASAVSGDSAFAGWIARNSTLTEVDGVLHVAGEGGKRARPAFIARSQLKLAGPVSVGLSLQPQSSGDVVLAWRCEGQQDFPPEQRVILHVEPNGQWLEREIELPNQATLIHLRITLPPGESQIRRISLPE